MNHSLTEENYLKAIFSIAQKGKQKITITSLALVLQVNAASVVDMLKKLTDKKLINYDKVKGARLTDKGNKVAVTIVRNHRLWEVFLHEKLGYSWDVVHEIAEQLEHIKHEELADRLDQFLGHPEFDPHGDPIPKANGELPKVATTLLSELEAGKSGKVAAVKDTSTAFLQYLQQLSIGIGTKLKVLEKIPFDDSMVIVIGKEDKKSVSKKFTDSLIVV